MGKVNENNFLGIGFSMREFCEMAYRKYKSDQLFDGNNFQNDNMVLIAAENGTIQDIINNEDAGDDVQLFNGILSPGLVNCHCHLELSHMRGLIPKNTGLIDFVQHVMKHRHFPEQDIRASIAKADQEMYEDGIVAVGDICNTIFTSSAKEKSNIHYQNFIEVTGFVPATANDRFEQALTSFEHFDKRFPGENSIVPHAPYSVSDALWTKIIAFPGNDLLTMHNQETAAENEFFESNSGEFLELYRSLNLDISFFNAPGTSSLKAMLPKFKDDQQLILVHNVFTNESDLQFAKAIKPLSNLFYCLCPNANLYISNKLPDLNLLLKYDVPIALGTDSLASNDQLSILKEMQTIQQHFPFIPTVDLLRWATINGARALQMENLLGSFEIGKKPGIILIESNLSRARRLL